MRILQHLKTIGFVAALCLGTSLSLGAQTYQALYSFSGADLFPGKLVQGRNGTFYTVSGLGGSNGWGAVLNISFNGVTTIYDFCSLTNCDDGAYPQGVLQGADGSLYGTTFTGAGTVFKVASSGTFTTMHIFCRETNCADGMGPEAGLLQAASGGLFGTTSSGGNLGAHGSSSGTLFEITPGGTFTSLYKFCSVAGCKDGANPSSELIQALNGNLYGTTPWGGAHNAGTIFVVTGSGQVKTIYSFNATSSVSPINLLLAADGTIYGLTEEGGAHGYGSIFRIDSAGQLGTLYDFCSQSNCTDGEFPSSLLQGPDGNFYGTTTAGGTGSGTIFELTPNGSLTTLHNFCQRSNCLDGTQPLTLTLATNGTLYGTSYVGGKFGDGVLFSLQTGLQPVVQSSPAGGHAGAIIGILGNGLTGTTSVTFNGMPATFTVVSDTFISATVPSGATTGPIQVTRPSGVLSSIGSFLVR